MRYLTIGLLLMMGKLAFAGNMLTTTGVSEASVRQRLSKDWEGDCEFPEGVLGFRFDATVSRAGYMTQHRITLLPEGTTNHPLTFCLLEQIQPARPFTGSHASGGMVSYQYNLPVEEPPPQEEAQDANGTITITIKGDGEVSVQVKGTVQPQVVIQTND